MPKEYTDEEVFGGAKKTYSDEEVFGAPVIPEQQPTEPTLLPKLSGHTHAIPAALGLLEQPGAGLYSMMTQSVAGTMSLYTAALRSMSTGDNYADAFIDDYHHAVDAAPKYVPITPEGAAITKALGTVLGSAVEKFGDTSYHLGRIPMSPGDFIAARLNEESGMPGSKTAGAIGQGAMALLELASGEATKAKPAGPPLDPIVRFERDFPKTAAAIDASRVGKIIPRLKATEAEDPVGSATVKVMDAVDSALNEELGIDPLREQHAASKLPVSDKLKMVIAKYGGDKMPANEQIQIANSYAEKFRKLQDYQDAVIASRPRLPDKRPDFTVDTEGIAATPDQRINSLFDELVGKSKEAKAIDEYKPKFQPGDDVYVPGAEIPDTVKMTVPDKMTGEVNYIFPRIGKDGKPTQISVPESKLSRQAGIIDLAGLDKNLPAAVKAAREAASRSWTVVNPDEAARRAEKALDDNYKAMDEKRKILSMQTLKSIRRGTVSHDYDLQHDLEASGPLGEQAMLQMNVEHNATMVAKTRYDKSTKAIFDDLSREQTRTLEKIIRARRIVQIDQYKGVGKVRHEGGTTGPDQQAYLKKLEERDPKMFKYLDKKATDVFTEEKINLKRLLDKEIIDQATYDKMKNLDYTRTEYLDIVDPEIPITSKIKGVKSIRSSGIPLLGHGKTSAVNMDARTMLMEDIARVENRIARNDTLNAMYELAEQNPGNGIVELSKSVSKEGEVKAVPEGWTSVGVRREGKQKHIIMRNEYAEQFVSRPDAGLNTVVFNLGDHQITLGTMLRTFSLSNVLRATATTYNPFFPIAGLPMDIFHVWMASSGAYSPHLPTYLMQMGKDLAVTAKDAIFHEGRWTQAMQEGMGPNFMTHEMRGAVFGREGTLKAMAPKLETLKKILSYAGDTQDTWVRIAHRERLIRQGYDSKTATAKAIQRLNYYRGGVLTKWVDAIIPYTNITVNATARAIETGVKDPKGMATKVAWIVGVSAATKLASMITSPETDKAISTDDKVRNFNITFGDQYFVVDPDGNKRYVYVPIRLDQVIMPFNAAVVGGLEAAEYGRAPDGVITKAVGQINPLSSMFPPSLNAIRAYSDNYDAFKDSPIYKGTKVKPEDQLRTYARGAATPAPFIKLGALTGMSPMGLEAAAKQIINTNNPWIQLMGGAYKLLFEGMDPREQSESTLQFLQGTGLSRIVKLTSPGTAMMKDLQKAEEETGSKKKREVDGLEQLLFQLQQGKGSVTQKTVENYINSQPVEDRKSLVTHAKYTWNVDKILKKYQASEGIPPRAWWIASAKIPDAARAQVFYNEWVSTDAEGRKRMLEIANALHNSGVGYVSPGFQRALAKERQLLGDDRR